MLFSLNIPSDSFKLQLTNKEEVFKILSNVDLEKTCGLDDIPCRMLKDGAEIFRSDPPEVFLVKCVLKICSKFTREHHAEVRFQ